MVLNQAGIDQLGHSLRLKLVEQPFTPLLNRFGLLGSVEFMIICSLVTISYLLLKRYYLLTFLFLSVNATGIILNFFVKILFQRERPGSERVIRLFNFELELASYSFPSGHVMRVTILVLSLLYLVKFLFTSSKKILLNGLAGGCILLVALNRIISNAHFLTDVIAAISLSLTFFYIIIYWFQSTKFYSTCSPPS